MWHASNRLEFKGHRTNVNLHTLPTDLKSHIESYASDSVPAYIMESDDKNCSTGNHNFEVTLFSKKKHFNLLTS